jgi:hypothetical protein
VAVNGLLPFNVVWLRRHSFRPVGLHCANAPTEHQPTIVNHEQSRMPRSPPCVSTEPSCRALQELNVRSRAILLCSLQQQRRSEPQDRQLNVSDVLRYVIANVNMIARRTVPLDGGSVMNLWYVGHVTTGVQGNR